MKNKCFVIGCLFALLGYELAILLYVLSFPNIYDLWWAVFLGNWSRIFLEYVPKELKDFSLVDVIMPLTMVCTVAVLFNSFRKMLLTTLLIELIVWQFLGLAYVLDIIGWQIGQKSKRVRTFCIRLTIMDVIMIIA